MDFLAPTSLNTLNTFSMYDVDTGTIHITNDHAKIASVDNNQLISNDGKHRFIFFPIGLWVSYDTKAIFNKKKALVTNSVCGLDHLTITKTFIDTKCSMEAICSTSNCIPTFKKSTYTDTMNGEIPDTEAG